MHYTADNPPPKVVLVDFGPSLTRQSEANACDINKIMKKYEKTGILPQRDRPLMFADVSTVGDYRSALHSVRRAEELFAAQPAEVRRKFDNDPALFLDFCSNPKNRDEMKDLGLLEKDPDPIPFTIVGDPTGGAGPA